MDGVYGEPLSATQPALGIDVGVSGVRAALVDVAHGVLMRERYRLPLPQPDDPDALGGALEAIIRHFGWRGPVGVAIPALVREGVAYASGGSERSWEGVEIGGGLRLRSSCPVTALNEAAATARAEALFGAARGQPGTVVLLTLGGAVGGALIAGTSAIAPLHVGAIAIDGHPADDWASDATRKRDRLSWKAWAERLDMLLTRVDQLFTPDLFVLGGEVIRHHERFLPRITGRVPVLPAALRHTAAIVGAAVTAAERAVAGP